MSFKREEQSARPLYLFLMCDSSGSMHGIKINSLNTAIREAIPEMRRIAEENPFAGLFVRVVEFSQGARWLSDEAVPIEEFVWADLSAANQTDMGAAFKMVAEALKIPPMPKRAYPPVLVLVTDGQPTDEYETGLSEILNTVWGEKAVRIAIGIGEDCDFDVLEEFMDGMPIAPLEARNAAALVNHIKWASTTVIKEVSQPSSKPKARELDRRKESDSVWIPQPPAPGTDPDDFEF
ncbi:VWA domain-containing protein [Mesotoga prima]|uniref:vWA domain-containing protein n=1 Tax=Mesotoga prima TaxID=1184387 RepID=UPI002595FA07|nr:VWA domain-containing protein [Mesotoga prima]HNQ71519.1 VWA domain-containing protein [Mesotoga prima]HNS76175.1 VWA domain-containing protein [Mesotoga prima]